MATDGVNNNASISFDLSKYKNINQGNDVQVEKNISIFTKDVKQFVDKAQLSGGEIDPDEENLFFECLHKIDDIVGNLSQSLKTKLEASLKNLFSFVIGNTMSERYIGDNLVYEDGNVTFKDETALEPQETDEEIVRIQYGPDQINEAAETYWSDCAKVNKNRNDPDAFADAKMAFDDKYSNVIGNPEFHKLAEQKRNEYLAKGIGRAMKKARQHGTTPANAAEVLGLNPNDFHARSSKITKRRR